MMLLLFFGFAVAADFMSVLWKHYHDRGNVLGVAVVSMALEALGWVAVWFAIVGEDWRIAGVSIAGSGVGAAWGMLRVRNQKDTEPDCSA